MLHIKTINQNGDRKAEAETVGLNVAGETITIDTDEVVSLAYDSLTAGLIIVEDQTNEKGAVLAVHNAGGTATPTKVSGHADVTITKDSASKLNVYFEAGVLTVQSKLAAEAVVNVKVYG